jgi:hypothetical protein
MVAVRKGIQAAQKTRAASHMRQIILAYEDYTHGPSGDLRTISESRAQSWIAKLARRGYFNDPRLVAFDFDPLVSRHNANFDAAGFLCHFFGQEVMHKAIGRATQIWDKSNDRLDDNFQYMPLSLCFVSNLDTRKATAHTPLLWTRGLNEEGTWNPIEGSKDSEGDGSDGGIWGDSGGLIGFIGGRVEWFESLTGKNALPTYDGSGTTSNFREAINGDAWDANWKIAFVSF